MSIGITKENKVKEETIVEMGISILESFNDQVNIEIIKKAPKEKRDNILRAIGYCFPRYKIPRGEVSCVYEKVGPEIASRIVLGLPVGNGLTKSERHFWLQDGANQEPIEWLLRGTGLEARNIKVARWLLKILDSEEQKEALYRTRREGKFSDHTMDLIPSDCVGGINEAIARRKDRMCVDEFGAEALCEPPKWIKSLGGRVTLLMNAPALAREGREMSHCVGGYASSVKNGSCYIVSIRAWGQRATVEYSPNRKIIQMKGKCNSAPPKICVRLAELAIT